MITIQSKPSPYSSLHDDMWYVITSNNSAQNNFKFIYDVYYNGVIVSRQKGFVLPTGNGMFNVAPIVRAYLTNYFKPLGNNVGQYFGNDVFVGFTVQFGEEFNDLLTPNLATDTSTGYNFYQPLFGDGILELGNQGVLNLSDQYNNLQISNFFDQWLTNRSLQDITVGYGSRIFISYLNELFGNANVQVQRESEVPITSGVVEGLLGNKFGMFNLSAGAINATLGIADYINAGTKFYRVRLKKVGTEAFSNWITITQKCYPTTNPVNIIFLNRLGGFDSFAFNLANRRSTAVERSTFRRNPWQMDGANKMVQYDAYNKFNEGNIQYFTAHTDSLQLTSDWLYQRDQNWLSELVASPLVYIDVAGAYIPLTINDNLFEYKLTGNDQLFNLTLSVQVAKYNNSQFR